MFFLYITSSSIFNIHFSWSICFLIFKQFQQCTLFWFFVVLFRNSLWGVTLHLYPYVRKKKISVSSPITFSKKYYLGWWSLYSTVTEVIVKTIYLKEVLLSWTLSNYKTESSWASFWRRKEKVVLLEPKRRKDQKQSMHVRFLNSVKGNTVYSSKNSRLKSIHLQLFPNNQFSTNKIGRILGFECYKNWLETSVFPRDCSFSLCACCIVVLVEEDF